MPRVMDIAGGRRRRSALARPGSRSGTGPASVAFPRRGRRRRARPPDPLLSPLPQGRLGGRVPDGDPAGPGFSGCLHKNGATMSGMALPALDLLSTPVAWADPQGRTVGLNAAFARWLGISVRRLIGQPLAALELDGNAMARFLDNTDRDVLRLHRIALGFPGEALCRRLAVAHRRRLAAGGAPGRCRRRHRQREPARRAGRRA